MKIKIANVYFLFFVIVVSLIIYQLVPNFKINEGLVVLKDTTGNIISNKKPTLKPLKN
jgi:hypothetical protein